jgi:hypothetical protein
MNFKPKATIKSSTIFALAMMGAIYLGLVLSLNFLDTALWFRTGEWIELNFFSWKLLFAPTIIGIFSWFAVRYDWIGDPNLEK